MQTINDVRKAIKPLGFGLKTKSMSWGKAATYTHLASGAELTGNVFTAETREKWIALFDWRKANREALDVVRKSEVCSGLL